MNYFAKLLLIKTPFDLLQSHMEKVVACLAKLSEILTALQEKQFEKMEGLSKEVSEFEHQADLIKNDIRKSLPKSFLFPIDRTNFLEILTLQDNIADVAEEIAGLLIIKPLDVPDELNELIKNYIDKNMDSAWDIRDVVLSFDQLLEASFGGPVAAKIKDQVDVIAYKEHESNAIRRKLNRKLFEISDRFSTPDFILWTRLIEDIGHIAHFAEKVALRIEMVLDVKN